MSRVAILTPDPAHDDHPDLWRRVLARLQAALAETGIEAVPTPWTAHVDDASGLAGFAHVLPLLVWGYHLDHARWLLACETWAQAGIAVSNPTRVLAWNSDKWYLSELAMEGIAMPYTRWARQLSQADLDVVFDATDAESVIVKPPVSGGAWRTRRLRRGEQLGESAGQTMLVQPYLPTIETEGETSLLYFGGRLSHAVNKRPVRGEFRIQEEFGGLYALVEAPPVGAVALAEQVFQAIGEPLLYARIDMVPDAGGRWLLMEAELIEPDFYLGVDPMRGEGFARALRHMMDGGMPA